MSSRPTTPNDQPDFSVQPAVDLCVSAAVPLLMAALVIQRQGGQWYELVGQWSESFFQGIQLPLRDFPTAN
ncbi:MAG: hypothetical protein ACFCU8_10595 [Thermosynechococcaceae cyanobacterium]